MAKNDEQIQALLKVVEEKKKSLGIKPRGNWNNGVIDGQNINTATLERCVELAAKLISEKASVTDACVFLGVDPDLNKRTSAIDDALEDLKLRVAHLNYDIEKKKLAVLEKQLKDLRSEDMKTSDAISDIILNLQGKG